MSLSRFQPLSYFCVCGHGIFVSLRVLVCCELWWCMWTAGLTWVCRQKMALGLNARFVPGHLQFSGGNPVPKLGVNLFMMVLSFLR